MKKSLYALILLLWPVAACGTKEAPMPTPISPTVAAVQLEADQAAPVLVLVGRLIDGTGAAPLPDAALIIQGERIIGVGPRAQLSIPPHAQIIDLPGATLLPGLINTHVHNAYKGPNLKTWAQAGVTTVRDLGARHGRPHFSIRDRLNGNPEHAHLVAAGPLVTVPGGYPIAGNDFPSLTVTSPEDARQKINQLIDDGADVIKITLTSGGAPSLSPEEAAAIVETAHEQGVPVTAHATTANDLERALDAGVDDVAHIATDHVSDALIQRMVAADVSWVPTLAILEGRGADNLRRFVEVGGRVALGNDAGYLEGVEIGLPVNEIHHLEKAGLTPMQIIVAGTRNAAHVCQLEEVLGTLEAGKIADVLVVQGDPLQDLAALEKVLLVLHQGVIIRQEATSIPLPATPPPPTAEPAASSTPTAVHTDTSRPSQPPPSQPEPLLVLAEWSGPAGPVYSVDWSPDGRAIASTGRDHVKLWDGESYPELATLEGFGGFVRNARWSPDGQRLVIGQGLYHGWNSDETICIMEVP